MRRLSILNVAYPLAAVSESAVGGAEQVLSAIDRALVSANHTSIVVASSQSNVAGELVTWSECAGDNVLDEPAVSLQQQRLRSALEQVISRRHVDLVHMHGVDFHRYPPPPGLPVLVTLHLPIDYYPDEIGRSSRPNTFFNCVSATQSKAPWPFKTMLPPIPNGVPVNRLATAETARGEYALMLGRVCPEKGQHLAAQAAHAADVSLILGGNVFRYPAHQHYFNSVVKPLLDRRRRFVGPLSFERKRRFIAGARCVLIPSLAAETSSLVAMEAASCGTPVIAFRAGALPEVIEHGRTGLIVDNVNEMASAIREIDRIDPDVCRQVARDRFPVETMTSAYIQLYHRLSGPALTAA